MTGIRTYTPSQQRAMLERHVEAAHSHAVGLMCLHRSRVMQLSIDRSVGVDAVGLIEYGDASFHLLPEELEREALEEAADLTFYSNIAIMRQMGAIK